MTPVPSVRTSRSTLLTPGPGKAQLCLRHSVLKSGSHREPCGENPDRALCARAL